MRHPVEGTPYVPPICPVEQWGDIPNLSIASFMLVVDVWLDRPGELHGTFYPPETDEDGEVTAEIYTDKLTLPPDNSLAPNIRRLLGTEPDGPVSTGIPNTDNLAVEYMRVMFCDRVANCRGIVDGECWALGTKAVREVFEEI
ncbi:MAG TPA: hypothetical protein VFT59_05175 [Candidatus Saccharimonadales bacterium]|nr:hypothetical protein [Candidatus Saccharimonadales bacterium]